MKGRKRGGDGEEKGGKWRSNVDKKTNKKEAAVMPDSLPLAPEVMLIML